MIEFEIFTPAGSDKKEGVKHSFCIKMNVCSSPAGFCMIKSPESPAAVTPKRRQHNLPASFWLQLCRIAPQKIITLPKKLTVWTKSFGSFPRENNNKKNKNKKKRRHKAEQMF